MLDIKWYEYYARNKRSSRYVKYRYKLFLKGIGTPYTINEIREYANKEVMTCSETNEFINKRILEDKPCFVGRFGGNELQMIVSLLRKSPYMFHRRTFLNSLCSNAGFFPNDMKYAKRFKDLMLKSCEQLDLCGIWNLFMEDYVLDCYAPNCSLTILDWLEPYNLYWQNCSSVKPWTSALRGKRVLVIHPFVKTIKIQYERNRLELFKNLYNADDILPEFQLKTLKAVQTINGTEADQYIDWFEALEAMIQRCKSIDFDVAIIGCGAYGFPLAAQIKQMGKIAIHLGGATQRLFGIKGKRWTLGSYGEQSRVMENEYWVHPLIEERPNGFDQIEGGCYW